MIQESTVAFIVFVLIAVVILLVIHAMGQRAGRRVDVHSEETKHYPLTGRLAEPAWEPMTDRELTGMERRLIGSTLEDLQSKTQTLHDLITQGPGRHDRQLGLLANMLDNDIQQLMDRIERGPSSRPDHGRPVDDVDLRDVEQRR